MPVLFSVADRPKPGRFRAFGALPELSSVPGIYRVANWMMKKISIAPNPVVVRVWSSFLKIRSLYIQAPFVITGRFFCLRIILYLSTISLPGFGIGTSIHIRPAVHISKLFNIPHPLPRTAPERHRLFAQIKPIFLLAKSLTHNYFIIII